MSYSAALQQAASLLRSWGVSVTVHPNAASNGRPYTFSPIGVVAHHTASATSSSEAGSRNVVLNGRPGIPGPLAQVFIARDGGVNFLSYGRANHAGAGGPWRTIPRDSGNTYLVGVEVDNNGTTEPYPTHQLQVARLVYAALLIALKRDHTWLLGHKEWAPGRKIDPRLDMKRLRAEVADVIAAKTAPKPPAPPGGTYTVQAGDTLWGVASKLGTTVALLVSLNGIKDEDIIQPGQVLKVPGARTYTVRAGDTLWGISHEFGCTVADLQRLNGITDVTELQVGQVLRLPS